MEHGCVHGHMGTCTHLDLSASIVLYTVRSLRCPSLFIPLTDLLPRWFVDALRLRFHLLLQQNIILSAIQKWNTKTSSTCSLLIFPSVWSLSCHSQVSGFSMFLLFLRPSSCCDAKIHITLGTENHKSNIRQSHFSRLLAPEPLYSDQYGNPMSSRKSMRLWVDLLEVLAHEPQHKS